MRKIFLLLSVLMVQGVFGQIKAFRFALVSDTHIGSPNGAAEEDLRRTIADINGQTGIAFVVITGDITELGMDSELLLAKRILDSLNIKYYIIPGNHDTGWSESGGVSFTSIFGADKFLFDYNGIRMMGCASGPYVRMSDGHIPRDAVNWMDSVLQKTDSRQPLIFFNHYPLDNSLDNWYEGVDRLKTKNTIAYLCGHGHANKAFSFEGIPGVMGRSNLRAKVPLGGYNLVDVTASLITFTERKPGLASRSPWTSIAVTEHHYANDSVYTRPSYAMNLLSPHVKERWRYASDANVVNTPAVTKELAIFGNSLGKIQAVDLKTGKSVWSYQTGAAIYSSAAVKEDKVVIGSGDGTIYCLQNKTGKLIWKLKAGAAVLGCPVIDDDSVYIGCSDHQFLAIELKTGQKIWSFGGLDGPVVGTPLIFENKIIFGAWDRNLYALEKSTGKLLWSWNNGSTVRNFSPAACTPVAHDSVVYVVAPDRYLTALDATTGAALWRSNEAAVRESIGITSDGKWVVAKTMNDSIVAFATSREKQSPAWFVNCQYAYDHVPSQLVEKNGLLFFGTRIGVVYAVGSFTRQVAWAYKIDNSMVNTVRVIDGSHIVASTMDGKVVLLEVSK
ncbi:MAG: PQQ-binding-like beta-propeller repeat protein [Chitinophagaceae bacterium]